jgi:hypothetical protein
MRGERVAAPRRATAKTFGVIQPRGCRRRRQMRGERVAAPRRATAKTFGVIQPRIPNNDDAR